MPVTPTTERPADRPPPPAAASRRAAALFAIVAMSAFAASRLAIATIPSDREYDEGVYLLSARALLDGAALFRDVFSSQPPAFLESLTLAMRIAGDSIATGRVYSVAFAMLALAAIGDIARRILGTWAAPAAIVALGLAATFVDLAHVVQSELPALAVALASIDACLLARARGWHRGWLAASGALFGLSALLKLFVVPLCVPLVLLLLLAGTSSNAADGVAGDPAWILDGTGIALLRRAGGRLLVLAVAATVVVCVPLLFYDAGAMVSQTVLFQIRKHDVYELDRGWNLARAARRLWSEPAIAVSATAGLFLLARSRRLVLAWLICWLVATLVVLTEQTPLFWRHFVLLSPIVALAAAAVVSSFAGSRSQPAAASLVAVLSAIWIGSSLAWPSAVFPLVLRVAELEELARPLEDAARWIQRHSRDDSVVAGDDPMAIYLAGRHAPPALCDTSRARINSSSLTSEIARENSAAADLVVLRKNGRLSMLPEYVAWLRHSYEQTHPDPASDRTFWRKIGAAAR